MATDKAPYHSMVIWLTGLSGAGKSTIAQGLEKNLTSLDIPVRVLDGDILRASLNKDLGFSKEDRIENIRRTALMAKSLLDSRGVVIVALISPYAEGRQKARQLFQEGQFLEVFIDTPIEICIERDPKGLYAKAIAGEIKNFTGIDAPYEIPTNPDLTLNTQKHTVEQLIDAVKSHLNLISD